MNQNIKNFILEGEKEFDDVFKNTQRMNLDIPIINSETLIESTHRKKLKQFISSRQISLIQMIVDMCEYNKSGLFDEETNTILPMNDQDKYNNQAIDTISSKLKEIIKE